MGDTVDGFDKKRDHNQYGEVNKDPQDKDRARELPKMPNKGTQPNPEKDDNPLSK